MKFYLKNRKGLFDAVAEYNDETKSFTVLKGSKVSEYISNTPKFRGAKTIVKLRDEYVQNDVEVKKDVVFKSPSSAANFVTGASTNGCKAWKDETGRTFKEVFGGN